MLKTQTLPPIPTMQTNPVDTVASELDDLRKAKKEVEKRIKALENEISAMLGNSNGLSGSNWIITKKTTVSMRFDKKILETAQPGLYEKCKKESISTRYDVTKVI